MRKTVKLTISFMLALALLAASATASFAEAEAIFVDGLCISNESAAANSDISTKTTAYSTDDIPPPQIGDVNGDAKTDNLDAALILKLDAGLIDYLPVNAPIEPLSPELEDRIRLDYWTNYLGEEEGGTSVWDQTIEDVRITWYYGCFSGCEIVYIDDNGPESPGSQRIWVGNHGFYYEVVNEALAYKDGEFYTFPEAFNAGYLTPDDIYALGTRMPLSRLDNTTHIYDMGDYNFDEKIDNLDAARILRYDAGFDE